MGRVTLPQDERSLSGIKSFEDAGIYFLKDDLALLQSVDFFTPIVDDPFVFGSIAAANALSDIYAMGGRPISALALAAFPKKGLDFSVLERMLEGGINKLKEADVCLLGGHTVADEEVKFGFAITGTIEPQNIVYNSGAKPGDGLLLTKPLGVGIVSTGIKKGLVSQQLINRVSELMAQLNRRAAEVMLEKRVSAATDVTGFGLLGHCYEMSQASEVTFELESRRIPIIEEVLELASQGIYPAAVKSNLQFVKEAAEFSSDIGESMRIILADPQTSGGLLIAAPLESCKQISQKLEKDGIFATPIGRVVEKKRQSVVIT